MADPTAKLLVKIGSDTKALKTGLDKANEQTKGFAKNIQKHSKAIGIAMIAVGAAIVGIATKSVLSFAKAGDEVAKMAKRTGFSTIALSELRHAAELSGTSLAGLEKASRTLSGTILDANFGLESYTRAFDKIGLSYEDLAKISPEEQFLTVLEALAGLTNESERAALAADLFGRAGTQLLPMLSDGAQGLAAMRQEAHDLGIVFDAEAAVAAEEFTDSMTRLKSSVKGAEFAIADALLPAIKPLLDKVTEVAKAMGEWIGENETLTKVITGAGGMLIAVGGLVLILPKLVKAIKAVGLALKALMLNPIVALVAAIGLLGFGIFSLIKSHTDWDKVVEASIKVNEELEKSEGKLTEAVLEAQKAYNELRIGYGQLEGEELKQIERSQEIIALWEDGTLALNEQTGALESVTAGLDDTTQSTDALIKKTQELTGSFKDAVVGAFLYYSTLGRDLTPFEAEQRRALGGVIGIPGLAHGGIVTSPTVAMVGENGPEAVVPLNQKGGLTINFNEPVFLEKEESINKLADRIYRVIKKEQRLSFGAASG